MPYKSHAQRKFFNANRKKLEQSGVDVDEWNQSSKGKKLPMKVQESHSEIRSLAKKAAEFAYEHAYISTQTTKQAIDIVTAKRISRPIHSFIDRTVIGEEELATPQDKDFKNWQNIANYMQAARPHELQSTKIMSGPVNSKHVINQLDKHRHQDTHLEDALGVRDELAMLYSELPNNAYEHLPASYHPHANTVFLNERSPGVLMHELGHAIDMQPRQGESNSKRLLRWEYKPQLLSEFDAWRKGRKAYQEGYAADDTVDDHSDYLANMKSYHARKYPAYGTYLGGTLGGLGGTALGGLAGYLATQNTGVISPRLILGLAGLGGAIGGTAGVFGGSALGKGWAKFREQANEKKDLAMLDKLKGNPEALKEIRQRLMELRGTQSSKSKKKVISNKARKEEKEDVASLAKAAAIRHSNSDKAEKPELQSGKEEQVVPPVNTTSKSSISPLLTAGILAGGVGLPLGAYLLTQNNKQQASNPQGYKYIHYAADTGWDLGHIARSIREATDRGILNFNDYSHTKLPYVSIDHLGDTFPFGYHSLVHQFRRMVQPTQPFYSYAPRY